MYITQFKKVFISFLLGIMVFSSFSFSTPASAIDAAPIIGPTTAIISDDATILTVSMSVYATPVGTAEEFKAAVIIQRSGEEVPAALGSEDTVSFEHDESNITTTLVVTFAEALTGNTNFLQIAANALMNSYGVTYSGDGVEIGIDVKAPDKAGTETYDNGEYVYLYFDEDSFVNNEGVELETFLRDNISIATDGVNFSPLMVDSDVDFNEAYDYYEEHQDAYIYLEYENGMQVILGTETKIKIASGTIVDGVGNLNEEIIFEVNPPTIQSVEISEDFKEVTVTYNVYAYDNTDDLLKDNIRIVRQNVRDYLSEGDTASMVDGRLVINFEEASGSSIQIYINGGTIKDSLGNIDGDSRLTKYIQVSDSEDTIAPKYLSYYLSNSNKNLNLVFDEEVLNATTEALFLANVYSNTGLVGTSLTFSGNIVTIGFPQALQSNSYHSFSFPSKLIKDTSGNVLLNEISTSLFYLQSNYYMYLDDGFFSYDGRWMSLEFDFNDYVNDLVDLTIDDNGVSHLHESIEISMDQGSTFTALDPLDVVSIHRNMLSVLFHDGKQAGSVQVRIAPGVLSDPGNNIHNSEITALIAYNTPDITGFILSDTASEFKFATNAAWSSKVRDIYVYERSGYNGYERRLNSSDYTITSNKLTFNSGTFREGYQYYVTINAEGYSSKYFEGTARKSTEIFYVTTPTVTPENGITATIDLFNNTTPVYDNDEDNYRSLSLSSSEGANTSTGTQTIIFELMNGNTPVSIAASTLKIGTGTYTANFNVVDTDTTSYSVRVYVVSSYSNDLDSVGVNLATVKTQSEIDLLIMSGTRNNDNGYDDY